ncbi:hypothetical protein KIN20_004500 [Parelaphostrongylus tenuis]|uniref:Uncharacterized protein n=1 Tax=Parelaphostrongylus tenuis TaxID=148309 RepID=A0AAD5MHD1_PARTN|nr:hypothetical protein KIN20_004500 [Parelaphostrongylus tenuis]
MKEKKETEHKGGDDEKIAVVDNNDLVKTKEKEKAKMNEKETQLKSSSRRIHLCGLSNRSDERLEVVVERLSWETPLSSHIELRVPPQSSFAPPQASSRLVS